MKKIKTRDITLCAFFAALSAILSQTSIPLGPVPITFTHFSIFTAVGILGTKSGTLSQFIFVLLGMAGIPVFSNFSGGIGVLATPIGGFIVSYIFCALVAGIIIDRFGRSVTVLLSAMLAGWTATYLLGIPWFMHITGMSLNQSLLFMAQFLPGDALKTVLSIDVIKRLYPIISR